MSENVKLCKDCKHYRRFNRCERFAITNLDLVTGKTYTISTELCSLMRSNLAFFPPFLNLKNCGKKGRFWEAIEDE